MNEEKIIIRNSTEADVPRITEIYARSVIEEVASFELSPPGETEMALRRKGLTDQGMPHLVAEIDGKVIGYAYARLYRTRPAYGCTVENTVYIDPQAHRRSVGSQLTRKIIEECTNLGYRQMIAVISGTEDCASIKMHRALGFKDSGRNRAVGYKHGRWIDTFSLQLALGDGDTSPPDMTLVI
jgi:L-amino acid N-acyltransferase YncA